MLIHSSSMQKTVRENRVPSTGLLVNSAVATIQPAPSDHFVAQKQTSSPKAVSPQFGGFGDWFKKKPSENDIQKTILTLELAWQERTYDDPIKGFKNLMKEGLPLKDPRVLQGIQALDNPELLKIYREACSDSETTLPTLDSRTSLESDTTTVNDSLGSKVSLASSTQTALSESPLDEIGQQCLRDLLERKVSFQVVEETYLNKGGTLNYSNPKTKRTMAHIVSRPSNPEFATYLAKAAEQRGPEYCNLQFEDAIHVSPLRAAVFEAEPEVVKAWLDNTSNATMDRNQINKDGETPLVTAIENCQHLTEDSLQCLQLLLADSATDPFTQLPNGRTAIDLAFAKPNAPVIRALLESGKVPFGRLSSEQQSIAEFVQKIDAQQVHRLEYNGRRSQDKRRFNSPSQRTQPSNSSLFSTIRNFLPDISYFS